MLYIKVYNDPSLELNEEHFDCFQVLSVCKILVKDVGTKHCINTFPAAPNLSHSCAKV